MASQQLILSWRDHNGTLLSVFENLLKKNTFVDCTLAAEGQYLKAHKMVLSACSPYFELLFSQESEKNPIVILKDVEFQELEAAVNFMYRGEVKVCEDRLAAFLDVAESLQIKGLGCGGKTQSLKEKSSTLSEKISSSKSGVSPRQYSRKEALNYSTDSVNESANEPADCEADGNDENSAVHQSFRSESSRSSPTRPQSSNFGQGEQDAQSDEDNFENNQNSLTTLPQFSSEENEQLVVEPVIKFEPVDDAYEEEKSEDDDRDFEDDVTMKDDQGNWDKHNEETMSDAHSFSQQDVGAEYVGDPEGPCKQQSTGTPMQFQDTGTTSSLFEPPSDSLDFPQERPQSEAGKPISSQHQKAISSNLKLQKRTGLSKSNRVNKCPYCDYTAVKQSAVTLHLRTHTGERPYKCPYCEQRFSRKGHLTKHIRIHTGDKPYQCPECDFKSNSGSSLIRHRRRHSGEKPYQCTECDFKSTDGSVLIEHRRIHSGEKPYHCPDCDFKSSYSSHLARHRRLHSSGEPS